MIFSPFEQFRLVELYSFVPGDYYYVITNATFNVFFILFGVQFLIYCSLSMHKRKKKRFKLELFPRVLTRAYIFFYHMLVAYLGKQANRYFPFIYYTFFFLFLCNLSGLLPYAFTVTSHFVVTFGISFTIWFGVVLTGFGKWDMKYLTLFAPKGISVTLVIFLSVIEFISNFFRMFSLALRLLANMVAGHILLDCISFLIYKMIFSAIALPGFSFIGLITIILPIIGFIGLLIFEFFVCFLQAYIFVVLSMIYIKEIL